MISGKELFIEISNQPVHEDGESVGYFIKNSRMNDLEALLNATAQPVSDGCKVPEGWKLVPIDPTMEMINGFWGEITHGQKEIDAAKEAYAIMLAAAPGGQDD